MAVDATGSPSPLGIPKYNVNVDAPSGLGLNAIVDSLDTLIAARVTKPTGVVSGEVPVWNGASWDRSSVTKIGYGSFVRAGANLTAAGTIAITDLIHILNAGSGATISTINGGFAGAVLTLANRTGGNVTLNSAGNIFATPAAGSITVADKGAVTLAWDSINSVWLVVSVATASGPTWTYATTPPGSPATGDIWVCVDSLTAPTFQWMFRWNGSSTNADKWEFVGGSTLHAQVDTAESTASTTYVALTTAGPSVTLPRAGQYIIRQGFRLTSSSAVGLQFMSYDIGGTGAVDADATVVSVVTGGDYQQSVSRQRQKTIAAGATALVSKYRGSGVGQTFGERWISAEPIRVS